MAIRRTFGLSDPLELGSVSCLAALNVDLASTRHSEAYLIHLLRSAQVDKQLLWVEPRGGPEFLHVSK